MRRGGWRWARRSPSVLRHTSWRSTQCPGAELPSRGGYADLAILEPVYREWRRRALDQADEARREFEEIARQRGLSCEWRALAEGSEADPALHARYADLTILGQIDPGNEEMAMIRPRPERVVLASGRPILVVPYAGDFTALAKSVLIGWDASREAARAVADAMPILAAADTVTVLAIDPQPGAGRGRRSLRCRFRPPSRPPSGQGADRTHPIGRGSGRRYAAVARRRSRRRPPGDGRLRPLAGPRTLAGGATRRLDSMTVPERDVASRGDSRVEASSRMVGNLLSDSA